MTLSHRERVIKALSHQEPDRVPFDLGSTMSTSVHVDTYQKLKAHFGVDAEDVFISKMTQIVAVDESILQALDIDLRGVVTGAPDSSPNIPVGEDGYQDEYGVVRRKPPSSRYYDQVKCPLSGPISLRDIINFPWPDPSDPGYTRGLREQLRYYRENTDYATVLRLPSPFVMTSQFMRGFEDWYMDLAADKKLAAAIDNSDSIIYFPLHQEPERVLLIASPFYTNQLETIRHLAKSIPVNHKLYVKEHPTQSIRGWRELSFYKQILDIPNVVFLHPSVSSEEIMKNSSLVVTVGGTSGLEAVFYKKPSIIFSDMIYEKLSSVTKIVSLNELPQTIKQSLYKEVNLEELDKFVTLIEKNSFNFDHTGFQLDYINYFYFGGHYADVEISVEKMKAFLNIHKNKLEFLAEQFIKKIHQHKNSTGNIETQ